MTMRNGLVQQETKFKKRIASKDLSSYKVVTTGQLVVGFPIDEGVLDFQQNFEAGIVSPAYGIWDLQHETDIDRNYLGKYLKSPFAISYYRSKMQGSTARRRSLPAPIFLDLPVPLPPLDEQRRIAAILDQAAALSQKRIQTLQLFDQLLEAKFRNTFLTGESATEQAPLGEITSLTAGKSIIAESQSGSGKFRVLKISAVTSGKFLAGESKLLPIDYNPPKSHLINQGDLLMSRANTAQLVGATAIVDRPVDGLALPDKIWKFNWHNDRSSPYFYSSLLATREFRRKISALSSGSSGSMKNIPKQKLLSMNVPVVSFDRQKDFEEQARSLGEKRKAIENSAESINTLLRSLQACAFRGEL